MSGTRSPAARGEKVRGALWVLLLACATSSLLSGLGGADAAYVHNDSQGIHPGCIASNPDFVDRVKSANRTCPGKPMSAVWDFDSEIAPFNKKLAEDYFATFFSSRDLVTTNDFATPTFEDFVEPNDPPQTKGYSNPGSKLYGYKFPWQSEKQQKSRFGLNDDISLEWLNMTVIKEQRQLLLYIEETNATGIEAPTLELESALRDDFHDFMRMKRQHWRCVHASAGEYDCEEWNSTVTLSNLNAKLSDLLEEWFKASEQSNFDAWKALTTGRTPINVTDYSFLAGDADDMHLLFTDPAAFNAAITEQVSAWYVANQNTRLAQFLVDQSLSMTNVSVTHPASDMVALNADIEVGFSAQWVSDADDTFQAWLSSKNYSGFVTNDTVVSSVTQDMLALNDQVKAQVDAKWVADADAALQTWLTNEGYTYVTDVSITSVTQDMAALNTIIEAQVAAKHANLRRSLLGSMMGAGESPTRATFLS